MEGTEAPASGDRWRGQRLPLPGTDGGDRDSWTSVPAPHLAVSRTPDARPKGRGGVGRGLGTPRSRGLSWVGRRPPPAGPGTGGGVGELLPFPRLCHRPGGGGGVKVRPQVCGLGVAARGAAIFGDFSAAWETASRAAPSPPAAGPESPAGRGAEVTDRGRRALSSPYLVKEAADWPAEQKGGGGAAAAPPRWHRRGRRSLPIPAPSRLPETPLLRAKPRRESGGIGLPVAPEVKWSQGGGGCGARCRAGWRRGATASWEAPPAARSEGTRWGQAPGERGLPSPRGVCGSAALCAESFLFCNWAV